ncbi:MAG: hypothetical protein KDI48_20380, partial [Xanthomonadales bacterium]|nr:hypothetical protein [Xanthomonadales bacterium]
MIMAFPPLQETPMIQQARSLLQGQSAGRRPRHGTDQLPESSESSRSAAQTGTDMKMALFQRRQGHPRPARSTALRVGVPDLARRGNNRQRMTPQVLVSPG